MKSRWRENEIVGKCAFPPPPTTSLVFIAVCAGIKDIYYKVNLPDLTVWQKIKGSFYNCKKTIFPTSFFPSLLVCRH